MKHSSILLSLLAVFVCASAHAQCPSDQTPKVDVRADITLSETVAVREADWQVLLQARLAEAQQLGLIAERQRAARAYAQRYVREPVAVSRPRAQQESEHSQTLLDLVQLTGTQGPQDQQSALMGALQHLQRGFVLVDATDPAQVAWLAAFKRLMPTSQRAFWRVVVLAGDVHVLSKHLGERVWADQGARLTRRFAVRALPSLVRIAAREGTITAQVRTVVVKDEEP